MSLDALMGFTCGLILGGLTTILVLSIVMIGGGNGEDGQR